MKEQELFDWLKTYHFKDLERSPNEYDGFDCMTKEFKLFIELKSRNTHYDTLLLEKKKYDFLIDTAKDLGMYAWYINSTPAGIYGFALRHDLELNWEEKWLPSTTEFVNKSKMTKTVTFLKVEDGVKLL